MPKLSTQRAQNRQQQEANRCLIQPQQECNMSVLPCQVLSITLRWERVQHQSDRAVNVYQPGWTPTCRYISSDFRTKALRNRRPCTGHVHHKTQRLDLTRCPNPNPNPNPNPDPNPRYAVPSSLRLSSCPLPITTPKPTPHHHHGPHPHPHHPHRRTHMHTHPLSLTHTFTHTP